MDWKSDNDERRADETAPKEEEQTADGAAKRGFFSRARRAKAKFDRELIEDNPVFREPLHTENGRETAELPTLQRGSIDGVFLVLSIALCLFGAVMAYSASSVYAEMYFGDSMYYFKRHLFFLALGFLTTVFFVIFAKPSIWRWFAIGSYAASIVLLLLVLVIGSQGYGAQRWIAVGPITIQPSEIAKMALILTISLVMTHYDKQISRRQRFGGQFRYGVLVPGVLIAVIIGLVMLEKHLSGIIIIGVIGLCMMYIGGMPKRWLAFIGIVGVVVVAVVLLFSSYAQARVHSWLHIEEDLLGGSWQTLQGMYAIGSGGFFGVGLGNSRQKFGYVSMPQNDFIFTIVCEELGFVGAAMVIALFVALVWRGFKIASRCPDKFTSMVVYGLSIKVALQVILNIAVVTNSIPNTGISLPFFSTGGTALIMQVFEMGIILNLSRFSYKKQ